MQQADVVPGRVVELFAGVGGFRLGLEGGSPEFSSADGWSYPGSAGWRVVWGNQWEPSTKRQPAFDCYAERFADGVHVNEDIAAVLNELGVPRYDGSTVRDWDEIDTADASALPREFEMLVGGFPCQDYSVAKPLRQAGGLGGEKGALWWEIARILQQYRPPHVLLENVDRLLKSPSNQRGRDFAVMLACFAQLGYAVEWRVVNAADYGFPQRRRRVFIYATTRQAWFEEVGADPAPYNVDPEKWAKVLAESGDEGLSKLGVLAAALPCQTPTGARTVELATPDSSLDPYDISETWPSQPRSPWQNAGVMVGGVVRTGTVEAVYDGRYLTLEDVLLPVEAVARTMPEFVIPPSQRDTGPNPRRNSWDYLKGAKRDRRTKMVDGKDFSYHYTEGAVRFPEPLNEAARTILTGEGGTSPSRFKLVVAQQVPDELLDDDALPASVREAITYDEESGAPELYRRLVPEELERLDGFPDGWTAGVEGMTDGRRAFCMGNALVVGIVQAIGAEIAARVAGQ